MVNTLLRPLRRWPAVDALITRVAGQLTSSPANEYGRYVSSPIGAFPTVGLGAFPIQLEPERPPPPTSDAPAAAEMRFMKLHAQGRFDEMWEMIADDAQSAWGGRDAFMREMPRLGYDTELLHMEVVSVTFLESWTDYVHQCTYTNVARMVMRYRVRQQWREWTFDRQVHLVPAADGWRTLCYPSIARAPQAR
jgi:hypothetical protein